MNKNKIFNLSGWRPGSSLLPVEEEQLEGAAARAEQHGICAEQIAALLYRVEIVNLAAKSSHSAALDSLVDRYDLSSDARHVLHSLMWSWMMPGTTYACRRPGDFSQPLTTNYHKLLVHLWFERKMNEARVLFDLPEDVTVHICPNTDEHGYGKGGEFRYCVFGDDDETRERDFASVRAYLDCALMELCERGLIRPDYTLAESVVSELEQAGRLRLTPKEIELYDRLFPPE